MKRKDKIHEKIHKRTLINKNILLLSNEYKTVKVFLFRIPVETLFPDALKWWDRDSNRLQRIGHIYCINESETEVPPLFRSP